MSKKHSLIILLFVFIVGISGCTIKTAPNGTFGEKTVSIDSIYLSNNTTSNTFIGTVTEIEYYYVHGYLINNNSNDAFNVNVIATAYDTNGNVIATNSSASLNPPSIPAKGVSEFYVDFPDPNNNIARYDIKIVNASGTLK